MSYNTHAHSSGKEQCRIDEHLAQTRAGAGACAQYAGEDYDADDIINDGSAATVMDTLVAVMMVPMNRAR